MRITLLPYYLITIGGIVMYRCVCIFLNAYYLITLLPYYLITIRGIVWLCVYISLNAYYHITLLLLVV